jgi:hypothetical protein
VKGIATSNKCVLAGHSYAYYLPLDERSTISIPGKLKSYQAFMLSFSLDESLHQMYFMLNHEPWIYWPGMASLHYM